MMSGGPAEIAPHDVWGGRGGGFLNPSPPPHSDRFGVTCVGTPNARTTELGSEAWVKVPTCSKDQKTKKKEKPNSADSVEGERGGADEEIKEKDKAAAG